MPSEPPILMGKLHGVPELPPHYLPREEALAQLKQKLFSANASVAITGRGQALGVQGMGGIGKSVLAAALARDSEVRHAFPDGIYWLTVGQKPNLIDLQNQLLRQLTGSKETLISEQEAKDGLREAFECRTALLVVDDVWTIDHADPFSVTTAAARLLITTRNQEVLVGLGAEEHRVDVLSPSDALKMLDEWVGHKSSEKLPPEVAEVAKECGFLPLALAMIGAMIRLRPTAWKDALDCLRASDLEDIKRAFPGYPYPSLLRAIEVSVEALDALDQERYLDLAVFPEDQPIPEEALGVLWKLDARRTRGCMARLVARSLASWPTDEASLILHDLQRDLIRKRREKDLPGLHLRLLNAWDALPKLPDSYAWRWVAYHLVQAGRESDLRQLLLNFDYLQAKLTATDPYALIADYDWFAEDEGLRLIQSGLRLSAHVLARDQRQLAGQLIGRLLDNKNTIIPSFLQHASATRSWPWFRPLTPSLTAPSGPLISVFESHEGPAEAVAMVPDGRHILRGLHDGTVLVWDLDTGQSLRTLKGHKKSVAAVAVDHEGRRAITASNDGSLRIWDLETGQLLRTLESHTNGLYAMGVTPDGHHAITASNDGILRLWDLETGQILRILQGHTNVIEAVAVTPSGRWALCGLYDGTVWVWDLDLVSAEHPARVLKIHLGRVHAIAVTPDGRCALSGGEDRTLRLWDLKNGETLNILKGHTDSVSAVAISADGRQAVSASWDRTLRLWDLKSAQTLRMLEGHTRAIWAVTISADCRRAVSASIDGTVRLWELSDSHTVDACGAHVGRVNAVAITPDGRRVLSASGDRTLRLWDLASGQTLRTLEGHTGPVLAVAISADSHRAISASTDNTLRLWDLGTGQTLRTLKSYQVPARTVAISPNGYLAISGRNDGLLQLWDLSTGQSSLAIKGHKGQVNGVLVTHDGCCAISASSDQTLRVWNLQTGQPLHTLDHNGPVLAMAINRDGNRVVSASSNGTIRLWDLETGQSLLNLQGHTLPVRAVGIGPDSHFAVSASADQSLRLWALQRGEEIATFIGEGEMLGCAFAPDGETIIAGDELGRVHFLRLVEADETKPTPADVKIRLLVCQQESTDKPDKTMPPPARDHVFISYSHKDKEWLEKLLTMLKPLMRKKLAVWDDTKINAGAKWKDEIEDALAAAKAAVLLVSPNFLGSDFIAEHELPPLLGAAEKQGLVILWVHVSSCLYDETEIKNYQAAHDISKPLNSLVPAEQDHVLADVCRKIKAAVNP